MELWHVQDVNDKLGLILTIVFFIFQVKAVSFNYKVENLMFKLFNYTVNKPRKWLKVKNSIVEMLLLNPAGNRATEIIIATGYAKSTVYRIVLRLKTGKGVECKPHDSRSDI